MTPKQRARVKGAIEALIYGYPVRLGGSEPIYLIEREGKKSLALKRDGGVWLKLHIDVIEFIEMAGRSVDYERDDTERSIRLSGQGFDDGFEPSAPEEAPTA
jgi:hypothetical protein